MKKVDSIYNHLKRLTHSSDVVRLAITMKLERPAEVKTPAFFDDDAEILVRRCFTLRSVRRLMKKMYVVGCVIVFGQMNDGFLEDFNLS